MNKNTNNRHEGMYISFNNAFIQNARLLVRYNISSSRVWYWSNSFCLVNLASNNLN